MWCEAFIVFGRIKNKKKDRGRVFGNIEKKNRSQPGLSNIIY
jgi:hypothetical protein